MRREQAVGTVWNCCLDVIEVTTKMQSNHPFDRDLHYWPHTGALQKRVRYTLLPYRTVLTA
jgi:hypothetical protein